MKLGDGGIDIYYVDESMDQNVFAMSAISIPFLRNVDGTWTLVWEDHFDNIRQWRRGLKEEFGVPVRKELKGSKLASGRGRYKHGKHQLTLTEAEQIYRTALSRLTFLPPLSIITAVGTRSSQLYGYSRLEALLYAVLQRMRTACERTKRNGLIFFDEGHGEYRKLYRRARVFLPTGSQQGSWDSGAPSKNLPLDNFTKDANIKESEHSFFIQLADIISYTAYLKLKGELSILTGWQNSLDLGSLYDSIPLIVKNRFASRRDPQGIVRL